MSKQDFLAFYVKEDRVLGVAGMNRDREMAAIEELMRLDRMPAPARLRNSPVDFLELLRDDGAATRSAEALLLIICCQTREDV